MHNDNIIDSAQYELCMKHDINQTYIIYKIAFERKGKRVGEDVMIREVTPKISAIPFLRTAAISSYFYATKVM